MRSVAWPFGFPCCVVFFAYVIDQQQSRPQQQRKEVESGEESLEESQDLKVNLGITRSRSTTSVQDPDDVPLTQTQNALPLDGEYNCRTRHHEHISSDILAYRISRSSDPEPAPAPVPAPAPAPPVAAPEASPSLLDTPTVSRAAPPLAPPDPPAAPLRAASIESLARASSNDSIISTSDAPPASVVAITVRAPSGESVPPLANTRSSSIESLASSRSASLTDAAALAVPASVVRLETQPPAPHAASPLLGSASAHSGSAHKATDLENLLTRTDTLPLPAYASASPLLGDSPAPAAATKASAAAIVATKSVETAPASPMLSDDPPSVAPPLKATTVSTYSIALSQVSMLLHHYSLKSSSGDACRCNRRHRRARLRGVEQRW